VEVWQTSNLRRLRLGEEKKKKPQGKNIMVCPITEGDHNNKSEQYMNKTVCATTEKTHNMPNLNKHKN